MLYIFFSMARTGSKSADIIGFEAILEKDLKSFSLFVCPEGPPKQLPLKSVCLSVNKIDKGIVA